MADPDSGRIEWFTADPRAVLPLETFHTPRRLHRYLRQADYRYTRDHVFPAVIRKCAERDSTWISRDIIASYEALHRQGHAHSVEVWREEALVGGLYGVRLGGAFFGESIFNTESNAGKAALVHLVEHLRSREFALLEIQMITPLTAQFGAEHVPRVEYERLLAAAVRRRCAW